MFFAIASIRGADFSLSKKLSNIFGISSKLASLYAFCNLPLSEFENFIDLFIVPIAIPGSKVNTLRKSITEVKKKYKTCPEVRNK